MEKKKQFQADARQGKLSERMQRCCIAIIKVVEQLFAFPKPLNGNWRKMPEKIKKRGFTA